MWAAEKGRGWGGWHGAGSTVEAVPRCSRLLVHRPKLRCCAHTSSSAARPPLCVPGEGSYGQLVRRFGAAGADDVIKRLSLIWISHIHAGGRQGTPCSMHPFRVLKRSSNCLCCAPTALGLCKQVGRIRCVFAHTCGQCTATTQLALPPGLPLSSCTPPLPTNPTPRSSRSPRGSALCAGRTHAPAGPRLPAAAGAGPAAAAPRAAGKSLHLVGVSRTFCNSSDKIALTRAGPCSAAHLLTSSPAPWAMLRKQQVASLQLPWMWIPSDSATQPHQARDTHLVTHAIKLQGYAQLEPMRFRFVEAAATSAAAGSGAPGAPPAVPKDVRAAIDAAVSAAAGAVTLHAGRSVPALCRDLALRCFPCLTLSRSSSRPRPEARLGPCAAPLCDPPNP